MTTQKQFCCSSASAMRFWCTISLLAWGALSLVGIYWYPLHASSAATICFAVGIGCTANWVRNRTLHCFITGPVFFIAGITFLLADMGLLALNIRLVWPIVWILTGFAFFIEWLYATRGARSGKMNSEAHR